VARRALVVVAACLAWTGGAWAAPSFTAQDLEVRVSDGVELAATLYLPGGERPFAGWPAVILAHGLGGDRRAPLVRTIAENDLAPNGYVVLTYDARAHGESRGLYSVDGPREVADLQELFTWLAARPDVDDAHIGGLGVSYGGGALWQAAAQGTPFAAIEPIITFSDLTEALLPQRLAKTGLIFQLSTAVPTARWDPAVLELRDDALAFRNLPAVLAFTRARSAQPRLGSLSVPTFMIHGRQDFLFDLDQALRPFEALKGPKRVYFGHLGHAPSKNTPEEQPYYRAEAKEWFDHFLKGVDNGIERRPRIELAPDPWRGSGVSFASRPPVRAVAFVAPKARRSLTSAGALRVSFARTTSLLETFGAPAVRVQASTRTSYRQLVAVLSARTPDGREVIVTEGGVATPSLSPKPRTVTIRLMPVAVSIPRGSRLTLTIGPTSTVQNPANLLYVVGVPARSTVTLRQPRLTLPALKRAVSQ
jgi:predicted acyl esterase